MGAVEIVEPRESWPTEFEQLAAELATVLIDLAIGIDHVGSTSVPGLAAKDVIDVQVTVRGEDEMSEAVRALQEAGYPVRPPTRDHIVPGESEDAREWVKALCSERPGDRRANIHLRIDGRANQRYALAFRDYLRSDPVATSAYEQFKRRAARLLPDDMAAYADLKDPVCDLVYLLAKKS